MKKFLQKSCSWLVMLVAWFAVSMSAMAQDKVVTFDMTDADCYSQMTLGTWGTGWTNGYTMGVGSELGFEEIEMWGEGSGSCTVQSGNNRIYLSGNVSLTIASKNDAYKIQSIEFVSSSTSTYPALFNDSKISNDYQSYNWYYYETYEADEPVESVTFSQSSGYSYLKQIKISLVSGNVDPIEYTVNFTGDVPAGCSASYGDDTFTSNGSFEVAKSLKKEDLNITTTADYYADVTYDAENHTWTVVFKPWFVYTVDITIPSYHPNAAVKFDGEWYENGQTIKSKNEISASDVTVNDLNGYDESVTVEDNVVKAVYTESAPITYTVTFNIVPEGAYAWINGVKYEGNDTFQTNLELSNTNIEQVYCPEGYYDNSYYSASDHTFYINYIEYDKFYVVVEGTEDPEAGVKYDYQTYHNGDIIYTSNTYYLTHYFDYYVTPVAVAGYNVQATLDDHTITVTYTEKPVPTAPWTTNLYADFEDYTVVDNNDDGKMWTKDAEDNGRIIYTYSSFNNADDYFILTPVLLEEGKTYDVTVNCRAIKTTWGAETMEVVYGLVNEVEDLTSIAIPETVISWTSYNDLTGRVTIPATGKYYFALHATTPNDRYCLSAKTFSIVEYKPVVEDAKLYTLTAVTRSGSRYNWCVKDGAVVPSTTEAATPFVCEYHGEKVAFKTLDGKYLRNHDNSNGTSWLDAGTTSATGLADAYDDALTTLSFEKFPTSGDNISWSTVLNGELYAIKAARGLQNGAAAMGYFIMKNDGTFDGAGTSAPFFNDNYTSAFEVAEYVAAPAAVGGAMDNKFYGTYYADYAWEVPAGYTAYYASNVSSSDVTLTAITSNVVAANVGVVLEGDASSDNIAITMSTEEGFTPAVNYLHGFTVDKDNYWDTNDITARFYKLSYNEDETNVGFYWDTDDGYSISTKAYKAFLELPTALQSNGRMNIVFGGDEPTGIDTVLSTEATEAIYNLQGQRVNAVKGGVYVKGGKKIIVK